MQQIRIVVLPLVEVKIDECACSTSTMIQVDSSSDGRDLEDNLLELVLPTCNCSDRTTSAHTFLEASSDQDSSQKLMKMWNG